ncbi:MAG: NAD(P)/FAD-dependent oxidoreductase [Thermodesulfovibrionales bacterium]|nr:NAD(P)/FAD-dependent oxidoreductase [Thermodesulfovibrionales bacterium]
MRLQAKVLVVGGGPAGATAAKVLAAQGTEVILLERNLSFAKPCGGGLILSAFHEFSIPRTTIKKEIRNIKLISPAGEHVTVELGESGIAIVQRKEFDSVLREQAWAAGSCVLEGEFSAITGNTLYRIEAWTGDKKIEITAEYVIAADGVNSKVRKALGISPPASLFALSEYIRGVQNETCEFWFGSSHAPGSYSWVFPAHEGISLGTGHFSPGELQNLFEKFKIRKGIKAEGLRKIYRIPLWDGGLYQSGRVLFAGDSAGQVLPLTYEGIYYAMTSGALAAQAILLGEMNNYKKMWKYRFQKRFVLMEKLRSYFLKDDTTAERLVALHKRPEIQLASRSLWLMKDSHKKSFLSYSGLIRKFLH